MKFNLEKILDIKRLTRELTNGLRRLTFSENFTSFEENVVITAGSTLKIRNKLTTIPSKYIIGVQIGNGLITKTGTWDINSIYLINNGAVTVTATIIFLK